MAHNKRRDPVWTDEWTPYWAQHLAGAELPLGEIAGAWREPGNWHQVGLARSPGWIFRVQISRVGGVTGLGVEPAQPHARFGFVSEPPPMTVRQFRDLPWGEAVAAAERALSTIHEDEPYRAEDAAEWAATFRSRRHPGRAGRSPTEIARIARGWVAKVDDGLGAPTVRLADELHLAEQSLRKILKKARVLKILSESPKGRAGGHLLPYGIELLAEGADDGND